MTIAAGRLRSRVTIRRAVIASDGHGAQETTWSDWLFRVPAEVTSLDGREAVIASALQGVSYVRVAMRYHAGVTPADQLTIAGDDRTFNIRSAEDPDRRRRDLIILADTAGVEL